MKKRANNSIARKAAFGILFFILLLSAIASLYLILSHGIGYYQEGVIGFICDFVLRIFSILIAAIVLAAGYFIKERKKSVVIWWICAIFFPIGVFCLLKAPILDLPYINSPASMRLNNVTFERDNNYEYSTMYRLFGYTDTDAIEIFEINFQTYDREKEKWQPGENVLADVSYLPHTSILMELNTAKGVGMGSDN